MRKPLRLGAVFLGLALAAQNPASNAAADQVGEVDQADTYQIARLTGPESINRTDVRWNVYGTDLGSTFEHRGQLYMLFGDTFGPPGQPPEFGGDWRSNALAWMRDPNPWDGLRFDGMIVDEQGHAREILESEKNFSGEGEITVIPTNGVSVHTRMYLHYMSVREWGPPGEWSLNHGGIAYSDDDGETWVTPPEARWDGDSNFGQVAFVTHGRHIYVFGIPGGRFGGVQLARVAQDDVLNLERYQYWSGEEWRAQEEDAATIVPAPVGELSVQWNSHYRKWLMMYLNDEDRPEWGTGAVVIRTADCLTGPWSEERVVVTSEEVPQLYAPYIPPRWNSGPDIFFTLSRFNHYDVFWWHTSLKDEPAGTQAARCVTPRSPGRS
jgi:hypothetical protein